MERIPPEVLRADEVHHEVLQRVVFSRHLNPTNAPAARAAFEAGAEAPPFEYAPIPEVDELLRRLDAVEPPRDHPAGALVSGVLAETRHTLIALRDRTASAFHAMSMAGGWYPSAEDLAPVAERPARAHGRADLPASQLISRLSSALMQRGLKDWQIEEDRVMSARVLVDGVRRLVRVHPGAWFRVDDLARLVVHEIDVHTMRTVGGRAQQLRCFSTGLPASLVTEEGLALVAEERAGVAAPGGLARQLHVLRAIQRSRDAGFREVYEDLAAAVGPDLAWGITQRVKRGLRRPELPGVYAKDSVYLRGYRLVRAWLEAGGDVALLYVGKVSVSDPVQSWIEQGWVVPARPPDLWLSPPG